MESNYLIKSSKPLFIDGENLILAKANKIYSRNKEGKEVRICVLPSQKGSIITNLSKLLYRLRRSGIGSSIIHEENYYLSYDGKLYIYQPNKQLLSVDLIYRKGRGPLSFCITKNIDGFSTSIYFGEYFGNPSREEVYIYKRVGNNNWQIAYVFKKGIINHIHSLIADPFRKCVWILAGDFKHSASIWMARNDFTDVKPIANGNQIYRACIGFPTKKGLVYATDTQQIPNSIRILKKDQSNKWQSIELKKINGSCIYGSELKNYYIFSTSTEPTEATQGIFKSTFDNKPAPAIEKNESHIIAMKKDTGEFFIISKRKKDIWPYRLFQFGTIMFPTNASHTNTLYAYNIGSITNDLSIDIFDLNNLQN